MEERKLSEREVVRKAIFDKICKEKTKEGYKKVDLTVTAAEGNIKGVL